MEHDKAFSMVTDVIAKQFHYAKERISRETTARDVPGWDSLAHGILIMDIESLVGCPLPFEQTFGAKNVGDLIDAVAENAA